jgi:hypothetical protein
VCDLKTWRYEGVIYQKTQDPRNQHIPPDTPPWEPAMGVSAERPDALNPPGVHAMWAPDVVHGLDGKYYLYYCLDFLPEIGVAVSDSPAGKFEYLGLVSYADGTPLGEKQGDLVQFDPGVFIDVDRTIYLYSGNAPRVRPEGGLQNTGNHGSQVMTLESDMRTLKTEPARLLPDIYGSKGTSFEGHEFFEASSIRVVTVHGKRLYYFVYSSVNSHELCYAVSARPDSGYLYGGTLVDIGDVFLEGRTDKDALNPLGNTHGGMECIDGKWYIFYHRQTNRTQFSRQACAEELHIDSEGRISQAEVTSCGLNCGPLTPQAGAGRYPASICARLTGAKGAAFSSPAAMNEDFPYITQDAGDVDPASEEASRDAETPFQHIANIRDGAVIGYKYFDFEGIRSISLKVRGKAKGTFIVLCAPRFGRAAFEDARVVGAVPCVVSGAEWTDLRGSVTIPDGVYALYLHFEGEGSVDLLQFELDA